jgi:hypothetical protein
MSALSIIFVCTIFDADFILLDLVILIVADEEYKLRSSSLRSFLQPPVISSLFSPNIPLSTLFSSTLSLCSSLRQNKISLILERANSAGLKIHAIRN